MINFIGVIAVLEFTRERADSGGAPNNAGE
jgi:hypothetical protein